LKYLLDSSRETLVSLRVIVLKTNLEFNSFSELSGLLLFGVSNDGFNGFPNGGCLYFAAAKDERKEKSCDKM